MGGLKYYERTKLLIELIEKKRTGSPKDLARKLGVKERMVYRILDDLKLSVQRKIRYCRDNKSYVFLEKND
ncbi:hypothetical protein DN752_16830 [Echinicola strongylocentroti]|uniref:Uncharacterized protein n=1 Tax=Echinicola strongylocentroti TaxID=1795355 RepID=A0A2Z4IM52_9BACT|nr:HTH domain-containing protein [Echinicola strongylocentroti]AWW31656.1 hypothetical protein DN752_16830 [Echinicola strongylocentroti]